MAIKGVGESQRRNLRTKGVLSMKRKQTQNAQISKSSEKEPFLKAQLTPKGLNLDGQGALAIRAVSLIVCVALIAIAVVAVVVLLTKSYQTWGQEGGQQTVYSSQPLPEKILEELEINSLFED